MIISFENTIPLKVLFLFLFVLHALFTRGQEEDQRKDEGYIIFYSDSLFTNDSMGFKIDKDSYHSSRLFFDSLEHKAEQSYLTKKLYDILVVDRNNDIDQGREIDEYSTPNRQYRGKTINNIYIRQIDVFGSAIRDTLQATDLWYKDVGNWVHIPTHKSIIRENLLFEPGDTLDPSLLRDNGRILRNLQYLKDARFIVQPTKHGGDSVDLILFTQDLWSKGFDVNFGRFNAGEIQLFDNNFLGLGQKVQTNFLFDFFERSNPGIETSYNLNNIRGSFIDGRLYYLNAFETSRYGVQFSRNFYSYRTRVVGGAKVYKTNTISNIIQEDTAFHEVGLNYINHDFWLGYALPLRGDHEFFKNRNRLNFSARYRNDRFFEGPLITKRYNYQFHDNQMVYGKISFSRENFYRSALIYGFGRTEDIPVGDLVGYTFGWEMDEFFRRFYSGFSIRHGQYMQGFGYLSFDLNAGGFYYNHDVEQSTLRFRTNYISQLLNINNLKLRQFFEVDYALGYSRFPEESLRLNRYQDIRGFPNKNLYGNEKLVFKSETVGFTNIYYYGFRLALYGFFDIGFLGPENKFIFNNPIQSGLGIGLRLRNENFVFNTFQLRLAYYPSITHRNSFMVNLSGEKNLSPMRYVPDPPGVVEF